MLSPEKQAEAAHVAALVVRAAHLSAFRVTGKDRVTWLNGLLTCELLTLKSGQATYGLLVDKKGKITCDLFVLVLETELRLAVPTRVKEQAFEVLDHHLIMEDAELAPVDESVFFAHGPKASSLSPRNAVGGRVAVTQLGGAVWFANDAEGFVSSITPSLHELGGAMGDPAGWEFLRVILGVPAFGVDFDQSNYPQEASLEKAAVSFSKGCYLGQEVVFMLEKRGHPKQRTVRLRVSGGAPAPGSAVKAESGEDVGKITSSVSLGGTGTALAMVKWAFSNGGTHLLTDHGAAEVLSAAGAGTGS